MLLALENGQTVRGDLIHSAVLRLDLAPIPVTLEGSIRAGEEEIEAQLAVDKIITSPWGELRIIKSGRQILPTVQGERIMAVMRIVAMLDSVHKAAFIRERAVIKEGATLNAIYRATGCSLRSVDNDFNVPRFACIVGATPTYPIARALQEEGGVVKWTGKKLAFFRLRDLFRPEPKTILPNLPSDDSDSGFMERHEAPWFYSLDKAGGFIYGDQSVPRHTRFAPHTSTQRLRNMTQSLVRRKIIKTRYDIRIKRRGGIPRYL